MAANLSPCPISPELQKTFEDGYTRMMNRQVLLWTCQACGASGNVYAMGSSSFRDLNDAVGFAIRFHKRQAPECPGPLEFPIQPDEWMAAA